MNLNHRLDGPEDAPVLVCSNSLGCSLELWEPQLPAFAERFRVLRYDQRGHGSSPVPPGPWSIDDLGRDVVGLLDTLGLERVSFCGLSLGGAVGIWLGAHAPERIERLALCCTGARFATPEIWAERAATCRAAGSVEPLADAVMERWFTPAFRGDHAERVAEVRAMLVATPAEGYAATCEALAGCDLHDVLGRIEAPTLVVSGADDPATPPAQGEELAVAIPGARFELIPQTAHLANVERTDDFNRTLLDFLAA